MPDLKPSTTNSNGGRPCLVTFSGIDGSGKTTQIDALCASLEAVNARWRFLRFWDDIAVLGGVREAMSHTLFKSEKGVGSPGKPVARRDKNVRSWYMTVLRLGLYFLDALSLRFVVSRISSREVDVLICDRYLYDQLANLELRNPLARAYAKLLLRMVPSPDVAFLLDANPAQARTRKPEYPLRFLRFNRAAYLELAALTGQLTIIPSLTVQHVTRLVTERVDAARLLRQNALPVTPLSPRRLPINQVELVDDY